MREGYEAMKDDFSSNAQCGGSAVSDSKVKAAKNEQPYNDKADITRGQQTAWIVGVIAVVGMAILYNVTRLPDNHPWKECEQIIGMDRACTARIAGSELMKSY